MSEIVDYCEITIVSEGTTLATRYCKSICGKTVSNVLNLTLTLLF